jgi:hypothetical protein
MITLTWAQVGMATEPDQYDTKYGAVAVTATIFGFGANIPTLPLY